MSRHSKELHGDRLRQLSDEISRIAVTLARLSTEHAEPPPLHNEEPGQEIDIPDVAIETVASIIRARRRREQLFPKDLFADPAWEMMLDLLQAEILQRRVTVTSLCIAAAVPATTALRHLKILVELGLFVRQADRLDSRRIYVELSPAVSGALRRYFAELRAPVV